MKHKGIHFIRLIALMLVVLCAGYLLYYAWDSHRNQKSSAEAVAQYLHAETQETAASSEAAGTQPESQTAQGGVSVDFAALQAVAPDVVGWIQVSGLSVIDYPIVHRDDEYYLTNSWDGTASKYGAIFMEEANAPDFSDYHTILYGHNMRDDSMFGDLDQYAEPDFYQENGGLVTVYTPDGTRQYRIFSVEYVDAADPVVYTIGFSPSAEYTAFLQGLLSRSLYDTGETLQTGDRILTLSTCSYGDKARFVVHAREITAENR